MSPPRDGAPTLNRTILALFVALAIGCGTRADRPPATTAMRIVSILPSNTEILYALGLGDRVVGVSAFDDYPPDVKTKEKVGDYFQPNVEKIVALHPDLVVTQDVASLRMLEDALSPRGVRIVAVKNDRLSELLDAFLVIGDATGTRARAEALVASTREKLEATRRRYASVPKVKVLFILDVQPLYVVGHESYLGDLLTAAGGENVAAAIPGAYPHLSPEALWQLDPDVILNAAVAADFKGFFEPFAKLRAVAGGHVHKFDATVVMRPGPRVFEALDEIAKVIHE
ncbi:MAG: cobalamin-binding protein [Planctomycetes bacterium]|nr:cobalamin-binding protein [Planctomycetota bacterium]MBI3847983.1 cobalamin-binding protein [Planctomycetota bacterium]